MWHIHSKQELWSHNSFLLLDKTETVFCMSGSSWGVITVRTEHREGRQGRSQMSQASPRKRINASKPVPKYSIKTVIVNTSMCMTVICKV
jgi:hypothetical protein